MVSTSRIANHAGNLLTSLATYRESNDTNERPIIFVCHSLGGLVCEDALIKSKERPEQHLQNILGSTRGIIFLGTPHHGAGLAQWAELLSRSFGLVKQTNSNIVKVLRRDSEVLARIQDSFHTMVMARSKQGLPPIEITCFYEELPLPGVGLVVPQDSAILPGYIPIGIRGNHSDMTKFTSADDPGFVAVCGELRRWIKAIDMAGTERHGGTLPSNSRGGNEQPGTANQSGEGSRQFNNFGAGTMKNAGGNYFEAGGNQNFVTNVKHIHHAESSNIDFQVCRVIPLPRNEDVVDRTHIFARLDALLPSPSEYQSAALYGLGGSGKTQVALEYAHRRCRVDPMCSVFWVDADNKTTFAQDFTAIARRLGLGQLDGEKLLVAVRERIESTPSWLLILDNADDLALFGVAQTPHPTSHGQTEQSATSLNDYVPRVGTGTVLWTSRDERIVGTLVSPRRGIRVGRMEPKEASILLERSMNQEVGSDEVVDAEKLLEELQWLPLAISQAGAYLRRTSTPIGEYLSKLAERKQRWRILKTTEFDRHRRCNVPNSLLETWSISIERIREENEMAYRILCIIAYVNNQDIPFEIMAAAALFGDRGKKAAGLFGDRGKKGDPEQDEDRVKEAVTRLKEFSFLGIRAEGRNTRSYEMHKLVQEATQYGLCHARDSEDEAYFSSAALQIVAKLFPEPKLEHWAECERFIAHAVQVGEWAEICRREREVSDLLARVSSYLHDRGRWREKEPVGRRAYELRQKVLGESHPDTMTSMSNLATGYNEQGRYSEAESIMIEVLDLRRKVLGELHPDTIWSMAALAATYYAQGRYSEAEPILSKALDLRRQVLGELHPDTIRSMADLAATYFTQGRYSQAEPIEIKVLNLRRQGLGETHPDTIWSMGSLATTYLWQDRHSEAEPILIKVLDLRRQVLGELHPDTLSSMGSLAVTYSSQGRYSEAEQLLSEALDLQRQVLGELHPNSLQTMHGLAIVWNNQGRRDDSIPLMDDCLQLRRTVLGPNHPFTKESEECLGRWKTKSQ
ncbi:Tetratricopeptide repeat-domain-containing protein [Podospora conica]|nr:Tetratricopeptide repeat-domain-containing protein [Schizothecium conicum]